jgi:hypothetical protein
LDGNIAGLRTGFGELRGFLTRIHSTEVPLLEDEFDDSEFEDPDPDDASLLVDEDDDESSSLAKSWDVG